MRARIGGTGQPDALAAARTLDLVQPRVDGSKPKIDPDAGHPCEAANHQQHRQQDFVIDAEIHHEKAAEHEEQGPIAPSVNVHAWVHRLGCHAMFTRLCH
ncbi:hypothetical protein GCM10025857_15800 [Alicyclobacillus contaminans]|nr:hypothetical protein GCM10025857_15800 [Alicyclobacillus contaminans]